LIALIVARAINGVIGKDNALPWHLSADLKYFKAMTLGCPVVMGRRTWESLGKALPKRLNIVVSRGPRPADLSEVVLWVSSLQIALDLANQEGLASGADKVFVIGGAQLFAEAMPMADLFYLTVINQAIEGDTFLDLDLSGWSLMTATEPTNDEASGLPYWFEVWQQPKHHANGDLQLTS
jgi:dihydrofolate reductase